MKYILSLLSLMFLSHFTGFAQNSLSVHYAGGDGPGKGKHVVLIAGDEEYRSEEFLPAFGRILAKHHGFECTVLFSVDEEGFIDPNNQKSLSDPEVLDSADAIVMAIRFRKWPADVMAKFQAAMDRGVPVVGLRTSTHAFRFPKDSEFVSYNLWGKEVLGEKWVSHWGVHKKEATRGVIEADNADHPVLNGVEDVFGNSDVYEAGPPSDATILMRGAVLKGMEPNDPLADYSKKFRATGIEQPVNNPMMPIAWVRELPRDGDPQRIVTCTMGAATDLQSEDLRRLVVNGVFWGLGMDVPAKADASVVGEFRPLMYGFNDFRKGVRPSDHAMNKNCCN